jgi:glycosyltransferase involved in cell wall biosynthesis
MATELFVFWAAAGYLAFVLVFDPLLLWLVGRIRNQRVRASKRDVQVDLAVLMVVRNQQDRIKARVQNILASEYPCGDLRVVVVSDGSTDATARRIREIADERVVVLEFSSKHGREASLQEAARASSDADILAVVDAELILNANTLAKLVSAFKDPAVGAACGVVHWQRLPNGAGCGNACLEKFVSWMRYLESRIDSVPSCTPSLYAVRRALLPEFGKPPQPDYIAVAAAVVSRGRRVILVPEAVAYAIPPTQTGIFLRRRREVATLLHGFASNPWWLAPWRNRHAIRLALHEVARLLIPPAMILLFGSSALLMNEGPLFAAMTVLQLIFYTLAIVGGFGLTPRGWLICNLPAAAVSRAAAVPVGFVDWICGRFKQSR